MREREKRRKKSLKVVERVFKCNLVAVSQASADFSVGNKVKLCVGLYFFFF